MLHCISIVGHTIDAYSNYLLSKWINESTPDPLTNHFLTVDTFCLLLLDLDFSISKESYQHLPLATSKWWSSVQGKKQIISNLLKGYQKSMRASLVAQWLGVCLPMRGTRVRALVWEDPTCRGATGPVSHNCWACASGACAPQQERPR